MAERFSQTFDASHFQRGNIHAHSRLSDGDSKPDAVIAWYRRHGYQFAALTDHNVFFDPKRYANLTAPGFTLISGEEITMTGHGRQVHVNALCTRTKIPGGRYATAAEALATAIGDVRAQDGIAVINHPNFDWALTAADVAGARQAQLLEIASGHPYVRSTGNAVHPSTENLWDLALSSGADYMGVAVDDTHHLQHKGKPAAYPGHGWVEVFAEHTDAGEICDAMAHGRLYASDGVDLERVTVEGSEYTVVPASSGVHVVFIGAAGRVLMRAPGHAHQPVRYTLQAGEVYVRARVDDADGRHAWTPAVRVESIN